jgi:hypothetical protein
MRHLTSEQFLDLAEGVRPASSTPHLQSCETCRKRLAELRATLTAASSMDVPEPSPLFWDHFSARVHDAVEAEAAAATSAVGRWSWLLISPVRVATFGIVVLALVMVMRGERPGLPAPAPAGPTASAVGLPGDTLSAGDDPSLSLMADLAADLDWDAASEAGLTTHVGVDNDAVTDLTDAERQVLNQLLKGELAHRGA